MFFRNYRLHITAVTYSVWKLLRTFFEIPSNTMLLNNGNSLHGINIIMYTVQSTALSNFAYSNAFISFVHVSFRSWKLLHTISTHVLLTTFRLKVCKLLTDVRNYIQFRGNSIRPLQSKACFVGELEIKNFQNFRILFRSVSVPDYTTADTPCRF